MLSWSITKAAMRSLASVAAARLGTNSEAPTLRAVVGSSFSLSQVNSNG